jgi:hypothetical protein
MRNRALLLTVARAAALVGLVCMMWTAGGCTHASANLMVDAPKLMQYQPPDIDDITGIDSDEPDPAAAHPAPAPTPAPTPHK